MLGGGGGGDVAESQTNGTTGRGRLVKHVMFDITVKK